MHRMARPRRQLSETTRQLLDEAWEAHLAVEDARRRRDQLAVHAAAAGATWREVGAAVGDESPGCARALPNSPSMNVTRCPSVLIIRSRLIGRSTIALFTAAFIGVAGCGSQASTSATSSARTGEVHQQHTAPQTHRDQLSSALKKLLQGGPSQASQRAINRLCTVPDHNTIHAWLDAVWGGKSIIAVAKKLADDVPGHQTPLQRSTFVNECIGQISATGR